MLAKEQRQLQVEVGTKLELEIEKIRGRFNCHLIGIKPDAYLIIDISRSGIANKQLESKGATIRYLYLGNVHGFRSMILKEITQPSRLLFLMYPKSVETYNLRKKDRIPCYIPAKAKVIETEVKGLILDLSSNGCRFVINHTENKVFRLIKAEDEMLLSFPILGKEGLETVNAIVKNIIEDDKKKIFGIQFDGLSKETSLEIDDYIKNFKDFI